MGSSIYVIRVRYGFYWDLESSVIKAKCGPWIQFLLGLRVLSYKSKVWPMDTVSTGTYCREFSYKSKVWPMNTASTEHFSYQSTVWPMDTASTGTEFNSALNIVCIGAWFEIVQYKSIVGAQHV